MSYGLASPGPCADPTHSPLGTQTARQTTSEPQSVSGSESRLKYDYVERAAKLPGPGQYKTTNSVGVQVGGGPEGGSGTKEAPDRPARI